MGPLVSVHSVGCSLSDPYSMWYVICMILFWRHLLLLGRHLLAVIAERSWIISSDEVHCPRVYETVNVSQFTGFVIWNSTIYVSTNLMNLFKDTNGLLAMETILTDSKFTSASINRQRLTSSWNPTNIDMAVNPKQQPMTDRRSAKTLAWPNMDDVGENESCKI